jgi:hypothetical protein
MAPRTLTVGVIAMITLTSAFSRADDGDRRAAAEVLFRDARRLMAEKNFAQS